MSKESIILIGGGGHCRSVIDVIEAEGKFKIKGIVDQKKLSDDQLLGYEWLGKDEDLAQLKQHCNNAIICVGQIKSASIRIKLFKQLKELSFNMPTIISPLARVARSAEIEEGSIVMHNVIVNSKAKIGSNCILNTGCLIEHDVNIESNCHISTRAVINGSCHIGANSFIGSNATMFNNVYLDNGSIVSAGDIIKLTAENYKA